MHKLNITHTKIAALAAISLMCITPQAFAACNADLVIYAVGNSLPPSNSPAFQSMLNSYMTQAGAGQVRAVPESGVTTQQYLPDALWINYNSTTNKITGFGCGH